MQDVTVQQRLAGRNCNITYVTLHNDVLYIYIYRGVSLKQLVSFGGVSLWMQLRKTCLVVPTF